MICPKSLIYLVMGPGPESRFLGSYSSAFSLIQGQKRVYMVVPGQHHVLVLQDFAAGCDCQARIFRDYHLDGDPVC